MPYPIVRYSVSIHAPGRGATDGTFMPSDLTDVSIHAPGRGATQLLVLNGVRDGFQFTHPGGVRLSRLVSL